MAVARSWVIRALKSGSDGADKGHDSKLCEDFRDLRLHSAESASAVAVRITALSQTVSHLNERAHRTLLQYLLGMSAWTYNYEVVDALLAFVVNLSTTNGCFVLDCLDMLHIVMQRMSHRTCEKQWLALYVENMLRLGSSSLSIDVEIRWEDIFSEKGQL